MCRSKRVSDWMFWRSCFQGERITNEVDSSLNEIIDTIWLETETM